MKLIEFYSKFFERPKSVSPTTIYVFFDEESVENWILNTMGDTNSDWELVMVLSSHFKADYTIKEEWCNAEIEEFYAIAPDTIAVVLSSEERSCE